jgi:GDSL-like Lipase/Acylhydrolase
VVLSKCLPKYRERNFRKCYHPKVLQLNKNYPLINLWVEKVCLFFFISGLTVVNKGCCGVGRNNGQYTCLPYQIPCQNREQYLFWDAFHPTEAANIIIGKRSYQAQSDRDAYPMDIQTLAQI